MDRYETQASSDSGAVGTAGWVRHALCGVLIGAGAVLPGVSGGVLAVAFGIYRPFMELLANPRRGAKRYWRLAVPLALGWCAGFLGFARCIAAAMDRAPAATVWLFIGLIAGTVPALFREAGKEGRNTACWICLALCALASFAGLFYVGNVIRYTAPLNLFWKGFCGVLWGMGIVIPGFTTSSIMMALGLYQPMLEGLSRMDVGLLGPCLPCMAVTAWGLARVMNWLFRRCYGAVFHGILGFVLASTAAIAPMVYAGEWEAALSAVCAGAGFALSYSLERLDRRRRGV